MEELLQTLDKENLFVSPIASPLAGDKLEEKILAVTQKRSLIVTSDEVQDGQARREGGRKGDPQGLQGVVDDFFGLGRPFEAFRVFSGSD